MPVVEVSPQVEVPSNPFCAVIVDTELDIVSIFTRPEGVAIHKSLFTSSKSSIMFVGKPSVVVRGFSQSLVKKDQRPIPPSVAMYMTSESDANPLM